MAIHYEKSGHVVTITIDRPEARNSLDLEHFGQLADAWVRYRDDDDAFVAPGARVTAGTPAFLHQLPAGADGSRLTLAKWLVDPKSPTTARAVVNRVWQAHFGAGLVTDVPMKTRFSGRMAGRNRGLSGARTGGAAGRARGSRDPRDGVEDGADGDELACQDERRADPEQRRHHSSDARPVAEL